MSVSPYDEPQEKKASAEQHANKIKETAHDLTHRERISTYFTIAAAACGLISDGCTSRAFSGFHYLISMQIKII